MRAFPGASRWTRRRPSTPRGDGVKVGTFLGDETRRLYGLGPPPEQLSPHLEDDHRRRPHLRRAQEGRQAGRPIKPATWSGTGWTGQPVDRHATRASSTSSSAASTTTSTRSSSTTGKVVWEYAFDDIIKSSPTVIEDPQPASRERQVPGARRLPPWLSVATSPTPSLAPYRAVSFGTGEEVWRLPVPLTASYSRDVDGSGFFYKGRMYSGVESGWFYKLDPFKTERLERLPHAEDHRRAPAARRLRRRLAHGGNLVLEASPSLLDDIVYISSGAGHVYGMRRSDLKVVWDYRTGSDLDGTPVTTVRRQAARAPWRSSTSAGTAAILMLDPSKDPAGCGGVVLPHRRPQRWATGRAA